MMIDIQELKDEIARELKRLSSCLTAHNTVLSFGQGQYLMKRDDGTFGVTSVLRCSRWEREDAEALAPNFMNGLQEHPRPMKIRDALLRELEAMEGVLRTLEHA